eukprot:g9438.t1
MDGHQAMVTVDKVAAADVEGRLTAILEERDRLETQMSLLRARMRELDLEEKQWLLVKEKIDHLVAPVKLWSCVPWVPDLMASKCWLCQVEFGLLLRRHHCRICGNVLCDACSNLKSWLPRVRAPQRTCERCHVNVETFWRHLDQWRPPHRPASSAPHSPVKPVQPDQERKAHETFLQLVHTPSSGDAAVRSSDDEWGVLIASFPQHRGLVRYLVWHGAAISASRRCLL